LTGKRLMGELFIVLLVLVKKRLAKAEKTGEK
jgi:hypothetical protein